MPSRHHVLVEKSFEQYRPGQRVALSDSGLRAFTSSKKFQVGFITQLAEEYEDGRILVAGDKAPLELDHSRTLLQRDGTLADDWKDRVKNKPAPAADRKGAGPGNQRA